MHVGAIAVFETESFARPDGSVDAARFSAYVESRLAHVPRCRQRLASAPIMRHPYWVDDAGFRIERHLREAVLEPPGDDEALRRLAGDILSRPLERSQPLWEITVVRGLAAPGRFAAICKFHHGMIDGIAGMDFIAQMLTSGPQPAIEPQGGFRPRRAPAGARLLLAEAAHYASGPAHLARAVGRLAKKPASRTGLRNRSLALLRFVARGIFGTSRTVLSAGPSRTRSIAWLTSPRADERAIRSRLGGTRDDVALAAVAGAARDLLIRSGAKPARLRIKAMNPVNVRTRDERGELGNRVSMLIVDLPAGEADASKRLARIIETTSSLRASKHDLGVDVLAQIDEWLPATLAQRMSMWLATRVHAYNIVVTVIPGPSSHLYALESRLLALYPVAPVFAGQHINVAALTYLDRVHWGVQYAGDEEADFTRFMADLEGAFAGLVEAARARAPRIAIRPQAAPEAIDADANDAIA